MRRNALALLVAALAALAGAPIAHAGGACTGVSVKGPKSVPETAGTARFTIAADQLPPVVESPPVVEPPPPDSSPPPSSGFSRPLQGCTVRVDFLTADGTAQAGQDYLPVQGSVRLSPGEEAKVDVPLLDDASDEPDEDFSLETNEGSARAAIVDDDAPPMLTVAAAPAVEGARAQVFTVSLSAPSAFPVSASYATADGTATAGSDYVPTAGTVAFPPGTTKQTVSVPLVDDTVREGDESFALVLTAPQGAVLGAPSAAALVRDNDGPQTGPTGPAGPVVLPSLDKLAPKITVPPGTQSGDAVVFTVSCPAGEQECVGRVRLDLVAGSKGARAAAKATTSLGSSVYRLKGGQKKKVTVKLNKRGKKLLKQRKKLRLKATFRTKDGAGNVATASQIVTLHAAAFRHS
jgi:hypothetical protein